MSTLSRNKDVDKIILQKLSDYELGKVCSVNKYVNSLCNDDDFWMNRTMSVFKLGGYETNKMKNYLGFSSYKELYKYLQTFPTQYGLTTEINKTKMIEYFKDEKMIDNAINESLNILPEWINKKKLFFTLRRKFPEFILHRKSGSGIIKDKVIGYEIKKYIDTWNGYLKHYKDYKEFDL